MNGTITRIGPVLLLAIAAGAAAGYWFAKTHNDPILSAQAQSVAGAEDPAPGRKPLYWYDPMVPNQRFDKPGKSPFMDMQLVPKYADDGDDASGVKINPTVSQSLGVRLAKVTRGPLPSAIEAAGVLAYNDREVAVVQARTTGYVQHVYARAPGDLVKRNGALVDLLVPDWAAAQNEFLILSRSGDAAMAAAARERLVLLGMPAELVERIERDRKPHATVTIRTPKAGVIQMLDARSGMTLMAGQPIARINGLRSVWLDVAVPEAFASAIRAGNHIEATLPAFPGETMRGTIVAVLPDANAETRTLKVRVELPNPNGRLKPGLFAYVKIAAGSQESMLLVPSEAVIRTGTRTLVMLAEDDGRYRPIEVETGPEGAGKTTIRKGLSEGQQIVASGQFLIDSEANLKGVIARAAEPEPVRADRPPLHEADAQVVEIGADEVTLDHGPFVSLSMPGMTMAFPLARPDVVAGFKAGDAVRVGVRESSEGLIVERLQKRGDLR